MYFTRTKDSEYLYNNFSNTDLRSRTTSPDPAKITRDGNFVVVEQQFSPNVMEFIHCFCFLRNMYNFYAECLSTRGLLSTSANIITDRNMILDLRGHGRLR